MRLAQELVAHALDHGLRDRPLAIGLLMAQPVREAGEYSLAGVHQVREVESEDVAGLSAEVRVPRRYRAIQSVSDLALDLAERVGRVVFQVAIALERVGMPGFVALLAWAGGEEVRVDELLARIAGVRLPVPDLQR